MLSNTNNKSNLVLVSLMGLLSTFVMNTNISAAKDFFAATQIHN